MLDSSQALPAMSGAALTGVDASDFVFISKTTISSSVSASVVNFDQTAYSNWVIWIRDLHNVTNGDVQIRWSNDNGTTFTNQNYGYALAGGRTGGNSDYGMSATSYGNLADRSWNNAGSKFNATINLTTKSGDNMDEVLMWWSGGYNDHNTSNYQSYTAGAIHVVAPNYNTAFEISNSGGNIDEGTITLYGLKET
jgi:hypothetical protein